MGNAPEDTRRCTLWVKGAPLRTIDHKLVEIETVNK